MRGNKLAPLHRRILGAWALVATGLALVVLAIGLASNDYIERFAFPFIAGMFLAASLVILVVVWLVMRFAVKNDKRRIIVAAVGPLVIVGLVALVAIVLA